MNFTLAELSKISLEPGEVLAVKLYGDDYEDDMVSDLRRHLELTFPKNKIMMFVLPNGTDLQLEKISPNMDENQAREIPGGPSCAEPENYCSNCSCGKKERLEGQ